MAKYDQEQYGDRKHPSHFLAYYALQQMSQAAISLENKFHFNNVLLLQQGSLRNFGGRKQSIFVVTKKENQVNFLGVRPQGEHFVQKKGKKLGQFLG